MFVRLHKQKQAGKTYTSVLLCESYRDADKGGAPRNRVVVNLGPLDKLGTDCIKKLGQGFLRIAGLDDLHAEPEVVSAEDFGHVSAVAQVWDSLGLSGALRQAGLDGETTFQATELVKLLVLNRLCDPCSKLALLEWLDSVRFPGFEERRPEYQHLLRAMDRLIAVKDRVEPLVAGLLRGKGKPDGELVFYDITSTWFDGDRSLLEEDIRRYGYSRDGRFDRRQITIGLVMSHDGIPLCHHVFPGNTVDKATVASVVTDLQKRFRLKRVVFVGDRGMLSDENVEVLLHEGFGYIMAHPLRRSEMARGAIKYLATGFDRSSDREQFAEESSSGIRCVLAYAPRIAADVRQGREQRLLEADTFITEKLSRLKKPAAKGRKPTPQGTYDRIRDYLRDKGLLSLYQISIDAGVITVRPDAEARKWEDSIDGMLLLETTDHVTPPAEIVKRYKELAEIERGWRALKSTLMLRPVYHWTHDRILAHVFICVLALQVERWMRNRLKGMSVPAAMRQLRQIKMVTITNGNETRILPTRLTGEQQDILRRLGVSNLGGAIISVV